ncbi:hypothetical protein [Yersinia intermedia]|uniref:hypothetical protein n=1 Tax=Yersinia intermedia TaxID=631 RepID=UPI0005E23C94|nr:hypothetical protein [Yersinia intermedia]CNH51567.1 Uncharacterised protein [Yersinia intermedia]
MIGFDNALKCGLPPGYNATFCFEDNGQSGVKMHYGVVHSENNCNLFKLTGEFLFDKDCKLSHEKSFISIDFSPQCPPVLEETLDSRTVIKVFLDWLMNLFHLNGSVLERAQFVADMENNIEVNFSKGNINQDNSADSVIESRTNGKYENDRHKLFEKIPHEFDEITNQFVADMENNIEVNFSKGNINQDNSADSVIESRTNGKYENDRHKFFEKISHEFDEITHYINNELDEYSDNKIEQMIIRFSDDLKNEIENDEKALKQLESDSVKPTQDPEKIEERNDGFEHRSKDDFEWDDAIW